MMKKLAGSEGECRAMDEDRLGSRPGSDEAAGDEAALRAGPPRIGIILAVLALLVALWWLGVNALLLGVVFGVYILFEIQRLAGRSAGNAAATAGLRSALERLRDRVAGLEREVAGLRALPGLEAGPGPAAAPQAEPAPPPAAPPEPAPAPALAAQPTAPRGAAQRPQPVRPPRPPRPAVDWGRAWLSVAGPLAGGGGPTAASAEARIGTVWLSRIGVLLLIAGAILGYRYGVTNNTVRVIIGYLAGLALLALGWWGQRRGYRAWAQAITGGGVGVLYLTTIAANTIFDPAVIPDPVAFGLMVLVSVFGTSLAVLYDAPAIGLLGMVGGFATAYPLVTGPYDFRLLFAYVTILDSGLVLVAYFKRWPWFNYLVFAATWGLYGLWRSQFAGQVGFWLGSGWATRPLQPASVAPWAFAFVSAFFVIFVLVSVVYSLTRRRRTTPLDLVLVFLNGFIYLWCGLEFLAGAYAVVRGFFAFALAAAYALLGLVTTSRHREDRLLVFSFLGLSGVLLTLTFPVALRGPWITTAWALEGAALVWLGFLTRTRTVRTGGLVVLGLALLRLLVWETFPALFGSPLPGPALRAVTFLTGVAAFYLATWAFSRNRGDRATLGALAVTASVLTLWYLTREIYLHFGQAYYMSGLAYPRAGQAPGLLFIVAGAWALYGALVSLSDLVFRHSGVRRGARVVLGAALAWLALAALPTLGLSPAVAAAGAVAASWVQRFGLLATVGGVWLSELVVRWRGLDHRANGPLSLAASGVAFVALSSEVLRFLGPYLALPFGQELTRSLVLWRGSTTVFALAATWGAYALLVMAAGVLLRSSAARSTAAVYHAAAIVLVAVLGVRNLAAASALRGAAFGLVVLGAYLAAFIASRAGPSRPRSEAAVVGDVVLAAAALTAWWGVGELAALIAARPGLFGVPGAGLALPGGSLPAREVLASTSLFAAVAWLGLYALVVGGVGARLRSAGARWVAIGLQVAAAVVLVTGLGNLSSAWPVRSAAFVSAILGVYVSSRVFRAPDRGPAEVAAGTWLSLGACALTLVWAGFEIDARFLPLADMPLPPVVARLLESTRDHWILLTAAIYGLAVTSSALGLRSEKGRVLGLGLQTLTVGACVVTTLVNPAAPHGLRLATFGTALGGLYLATWMIRRATDRATRAEAKVTEWLSLGAAAVTAIWLTGQVSAYFAPFTGLGTAAERAFTQSTQDFVVSAVWGAYGFLVLVAGFALRHRWTRVLGLGLLVLTLGKVVASDMWHLAVKWRIWITVGSGLLFVIASLMYQRFTRVILGGGRKGAEA